MKKYCLFMCAATALCLLNACETFNPKIGGKPLFPTQSTAASTSFTRTQLGPAGDISVAPEGGLPVGAIVTPNLPDSVITKPKELTTKAGKSIEKSATKVAKTIKTETKKVEAKTTSVAKETKKVVDEGLTKATDQVETAAKAAEEKVKEVTTTPAKTEAEDEFLPMPAGS
ncbi:MAG: hypothetical protein PHX74_09470 [Candidatus Sumerlaeales bacterium]|nr:hypothetical protein [Candidatus Sumerlaeales bacterium]